VRISDIPPSAFSTSSKKMSSGCKLLKPISRVLFSALMSVFLYPSEKLLYTIDFVCVVYKVLPKV